MDIKVGNGMSCSGGRPGKRCCTNLDCGMHPLICDDDNCQCQGPHSRHGSFKLEPLIDLIGTRSIFDSLLATREELNRQLIQLEQTVSSLRISYNELFEKRFPTHLKHEHLRQGFVGRKLESTATGHVVNMLLNDIEARKEETTSFHEQFIRKLEVAIQEHTSKLGDIV